MLKRLVIIPQSVIAAAQSVHYSGIAFMIIIKLHQVIFFLMGQFEILDGLMIPHGPVLAHTAPVVRLRLILVDLDAFVEVLYRQLMVRHVLIDRASRDVDRLIISYFLEHLRKAF